MLLSLDCVLDQVLGMKSCHDYSMFLSIKSLSGVYIVRRLPRSTGSLKVILNTG